jgi:hypothetical protein
MQMRFASPAIAVAGVPAMSSAAAQSRSDGGRLHPRRVAVTGTRPAARSPGGNLITDAEMWTFDTLSLDDAVKAAPGITATQDSNGRRTSTTSSCVASDVGRMRATGYDGAPPSCDRRSRNQANSSAATCALLASIRR